MQLAKIFGWLLFLLGLATIFYTIFASYQVFNGKMALPAIFTLADSNTTKSGGTSLSAFGFDVQLADLLGPQKEQISSLLRFLPKLLNLLSWSIFAGILIFAGAQIAGLGIKLIKD